MGACFNFGTIVGNVLFFGRYFKKSYLSWIHIGITLMSIFFIILTVKTAIKPDATNSPQYTLMRVLLMGDVRILSMTSWKAILVFAAQLVFVGNLAWGISSRKKQQSSNIKPNARVK